jgi:pilus assembly protein CpaB
VQEEAAPEAPKEKVCTIRTNKGGEVVETVIPCTN